MSREWKAGDVIVSNGERGIVTPAIDTTDPRWVEFGNGATQHLDNVRNARPLVVIDPEDRDQAERVYDAYVRTTGVASLEYRVDQMQDALRSLVAPVKPAEPTGLGAVVEDAEGCRFVRTMWDEPWEGANGWAFEYAEIDAVRVLSEGVTA